MEHFLFLKVSKEKQRISFLPEMFLNKAPFQKFYLDFLFIMYNSYSIDLVVLKRDGLSNNLWLRIWIVPSSITSVIKRGWHL